MGDLAGLAARAAGLWGALAGPPRLVALRENAVFETRLADGRRTALRLHRPGYRDHAAVEAEMVWTERLADAGFACPWPQRLPCGALVATAGDRLVTMVQWLDAAPRMPPPPPNPARAQRFVQIGALLADLHLTTDAIAPDCPGRPAWDADGLCAPDMPLWGRFWENPALTPDEAATLRAARASAHRRMVEMPAAWQGLIHADALQENLLWDAQTLYLIDFDDAGRGFRAYDLATALVQQVEASDFDDLAAALVAGYAAAGGPLSETALRHVPFFVAVRAMASAGWIIARAGPGDPRQRHYADRAVRCALRFLEV